MLSPLPSSLPSTHAASLFSPRQDLLVSLSQLLRGNAYDKLKFAFKLYDVNGDGCITKAELTDIVSSVHELMGRCSHNRHVSGGGALEGDSPAEW